MTPHTRRIIVLVALAGLLAAVLVAPLFQHLGQPASRWSGGMSVHPGTVGRPRGGSPR